MNLLIRYICKRGAYWIKLSSWIFNITPCSRKSLHLPWFDLYGQYSWKDFDIIGVVKGLSYVVYYLFICQNVICVSRPSTYSLASGDRSALLRSHAAKSAECTAGAGSPRARRLPRESRRVSLAQAPGYVQLNQYRLLEPIGQVKTSSSSSLHPYDVQHKT